MKFDHIALQSENIANSVKWYVENYDAKVLYEDDAWAMMEIAGARIALVSPNQHPPHFCFEVDDKFISEKLSSKVFKKHRDGSESCYIRDPDGNFIEFLKWPD